MNIESVSRRSYWSVKIYGMFLLLVIVLIMSGCGVVSTQIVESMDPEKRMELFKKRSDKELCGDYHHPLMQKESEKTIEKELALRNISACVVGQYIKRNPLGGDFVIRDESILDKAAVARAEGYDLPCKKRCDGNTRKNRKLMDGFYQIKEWNELIDQVVHAGYRDKRTYYYLGVSFYHIGNVDIAEKYLEKSTKELECNECDNKKYKKLSRQILNSIDRKREGLSDYIEAMEINTVEALESFISRFPKSSKIKDAHVKIDWLKAVESHSIDEYYNFSRKHPYSEFDDQARTQSMSLLPDSATVYDLQSFMKKWPESEKEIIPMMKDILDPKIRALDKKFKCNEADDLANIINNIKPRSYLYNKNDCVLQMSITLAKENGSPKDLYVYGMSFEADKKYEEANKIYRAIILYFPNGEYAVRSSERMLGISKEQDQIQRDKEKSALIMMRMMQAAEAEKAADRRSREAEEAAEKRAIEAEKAAQMRERERRHHEIKLERCRSRTSECISKCYGDAECNNLCRRVYGCNF